MSEPNPTAGGDDRRIPLSSAAAVIALAIGMIGAAALLYYLLDILLVFFLGVVLAVALQPGHQWLSRWGVPKGLAVLIFYLLFLLAIVLLAFFVGPLLLEQAATFATSLPQQYTQLIDTLQASTSPFLQHLATRLPPFSDIIQRLSAVSPTFLDELLRFMSSAVEFFTYFIVVLAIGFYWTMEVPRLERLVISLLPVTRRTRALDIWHEIEFKLGAFIRGQGLAMLVVGSASALGYLAIGLPNVLILAVLAGLLEAIPMIGPILAAVPAVFVALPQGLTTVLLVISFCTLLQLLENNVLTPRIMSHSVGISSLVTLFAILAFGSLYGVVGAFIAIPLTVVVQVLLEHMVINPEPVPEETTPRAQPLEALRVRVQEIRQKMRERLRERASRIQVDALVPTPDHVADVVDQELEKAVERVENALATTQRSMNNIAALEQQNIVSELQRTAGTIEQAVHHVDTVLPPTQEEVERSKPVIVAPPVVNKLHQATQRVEQAVQQTEAVVSEVQESEVSEPGKAATARRAAVPKPRAPA